MSTKSTVVIISWRVGVRSICCTCHTCTGLYASYTSAKLEEEKNGNSFSQCQRQNMSAPWVNGPGRQALSSASLEVKSCLFSQHRHFFSLPLRIKWLYYVGNSFQTPRQVQCDPSRPLTPRPPSVSNSAPAGHGPLTPLSLLASASFAPWLPLSAPFKASFWGQGIAQW